MAATGSTRLISHFQTKEQEQYGAGWSELWEKGESNLWDRGFPSPALTDIIAERRDILSPLNVDGSRKRVLVPGCGKGYDPVMLALHGFDVLGLEISKTAVAVAERYSFEQMQNPSWENFAKGETKDAGERGTVSFVAGDFFAKDWEARLPDDQKKFDLIYDYTFLCALHPSMRRPWANRMAELLTPGGLLICLEFPLWKDVRLPGPPWGLQGVYWDLLACGGNGLISEGREDTPPSVSDCVQFVRELYTKPERSYEQGRGEDMLSLWRRQGQEAVF